MWFLKCGGEVVPVQDAGASDKDGGHDDCLPVPVGWDSNASRPMTLHISLKDDEWIQMTDAELRGMWESGLLRDEDECYYWIEGMDGTRPLKEYFLHMPMAATVPPQPVATPPLISLSPRLPAEVAATSSIGFLTTLVFSAAGAGGVEGIASSAARQALREIFHHQPRHHHGRTRTGPSRSPLAQ